jgi:hypothetical protein
LVVFDCLFEFHYLTLQLHHMLAQFAVFHTHFV